MKGALIMRYIGAEKVVCPACGVELDVPLYQVDGIDHYGMKFCHQCGNSLFYKPADNDLKDIVLSVREGVKAMYHYSDDQVKAYWQGVDDCCKEYNKLCDNIVNTMLNAACQIDSQAREHTKSILED